ncbi:MAG: serine/threonine protein kinase [Polyangiaceae bacterium]|nr:serine/threonine protein kinase [Polyangiaceae bacterium]
MTSALGATLASRVATLEADPELLRSFCERPGSTIEPAARSAAEVERALLALTGSLDAAPGRFVLEQVLGEGGMGVVHLATQPSLGRKVAVKRLRGAASPAATLKLLREAWVTGTVEHPNVVPIHEITVGGDGSPLVVMKRIEGVEWTTLLQSPGEIARRFGAADAVEWNLRVLVQVCNAVQLAHQRGILHRDLKPENVMIGAHGEVYLVDWGLAVGLTDDPTGRVPPRSEAALVAGTPAYMAPEMLLGQPELLSERTDVYLLGAILYEIFAGRPPHAGETFRAIAASILLSEPEFSTGFPREAARLCRRAMARDPTERPAGAHELRTAIEEYLRHRDSRRLAWQARHSLERLEAVLAQPEAPNAALELHRRLGECRFGYRAALAAWEGNEAARRGLDRALLRVAEHELTHGDPAAAAALVAEIAAPPAGLAERVAAAVRARAEELERLRRLGEDLDARVGSRTRTVVGGGLGAIFTATPLIGWWWEEQGGALTHGTVLTSSAVLLALCVAVWVWARETLTRTLLNRRVSYTLAVQFVAQAVLTVGAMAAGIDARLALLLWVFTWSLTTALLAVWVEGWFAVSAVVSAGCFLGGAWWPEALRPLMALANLVFTGVVVGVWFPRQDLEALRARRAELRARTRELVLEPPTPRGEPSGGASSE